MVFQTQLRYRPRDLVGEVPPWYFFLILWFFLGIRFRNDGNYLDENGFTNIIYVSFFFCVQLVANSDPPRFDLKILENFRFSQRRKKLRELHLIFKKFLELHLIFYWEKCFKIWLKFSWDIKSSCQFKAPSLLRRGVNRQLVLKRFSRYLPHKLTLTLGGSPTSFSGPVVISNAPASTRLKYLSPTLLDVLL